MAKSYEVLAYGDSTATHIIEFDATGNEIASITDPSTTVFSQFDATGDGRVAVTYTINSGGTSEITTNVFDLRTTGWNISSFGLWDTDQYYAGTQFNDTVHGENNVNNFYYFVGTSIPSSAPSDFFYGGTSGWNEVLFSDPISNYSIQTNGSGGYIITNTGDPQHAGSVNVDSNVQALLFNPAGDPAPVSGAVNVANGSALVVLQATALNVTFANTNGVDSGELVLYDSAGFTGHISGRGGWTDFEFGYHRSCRPCVQFRTHDGFATSIIFGRDFHSHHFQQRDVRRSAPYGRLHHCDLGPHARRTRRHRSRRSSSGFWRV